MIYKQIIFLVVGMILFLQQVSAMNVSINPITQDAAVSSLFYIGIDIDSGTESVNAVDVIITYPQGYMTAYTPIYSGLLGGNIISIPTLGAGQMEYLIANLSGQSPVNGTLFSIPFYASTISNVTANINISTISIFINSSNETTSIINRTNGTVNLIPGIPTTIINSISSIAYSPLHAVQFIVSNKGSTLKYRGVDISVYDPTFPGVYDNKTTGTLGQAVFYLNGTINYTIQFYNSSLGVNKTIYLYPIEVLYNICGDVDCNMGFQVGNVSTNLTNYTNVQYNNTTWTLYKQPTWTISNITNTTLNSQLGIGSTGQGILAGIITWVLIGAGGTVTAMVGMAIMAVMGVLTWQLVLLCGMTAISLYVLRGWIG